ncbi:MAG: flippase [Lachnospiraceae bacterium]|nr:flippase [Lachnospiraceae bacterium]
MIQVLSDAKKRLSETGFFHIVSSSVINKIITFASGIILVHVLSKSDYGVYTYANNILGFCKIVSGFGIVSGILQVCSEVSNSEKRERIFQYGCRIGVLFDVLLAVFIFILGLCIELPIDGANYCLRLMCALPLVQLIVDAVLTYLRVELRNKEYSYANSLSAIVTLILTSLFSLLWKTEGLILAQYMVAVGIGFFIIVHYKTPFSLKKVSVDRENKKALLTVSGISMINNGLSQLMYLIDVFVLGIVIKDESVIASYKIATTIPTALTFVPLTIITYVYPYFARNKNNKKWLQKHYALLTGAMGIVNVCISGVLIAFAPFIIRILFGEQYLDAVIPFRILSASFLFSGTFRIISGNLLVTQRKLKFNLVIAILSGAMNTALNVFMIPRWGSIGAALATIITVICTSIVNTVYLNLTFRRIPDKTEMCD